MHAETQPLPVPRQGFLNGGYRTRSKIDQPKALFTLDPQNNCLCHNIPCLKSSPLEAVSIHFGLPLLFVGNDSQPTLQIKTGVVFKDFLHDKREPCQPLPTCRKRQQQAGMPRVCCSSCRYRPAPDHTPAKSSWHLLPSKNRYPAKWD